MNFVGFKKKIIFKYEIKAQRHIISLFYKISLNNISLNKRLLTYLKRKKTWLIAGLPPNNSFQLNTFLDFIYIFSTLSEANTLRKTNFTQYLIIILKKQAWKEIKINQQLINILKNVTKSKYRDLYCNCNNKLIFLLIFFQNTH